MDFIDSPVEQTTAATDAILALLGLASVLLLRAMDAVDRQKSLLWQWIFGLLLIVGSLGAVIHGFQWSEATFALLWKPNLLALGVLVALIFVAALHDLRGRERARRALPWALAAGVGFFILTLFWTGGFWVVIAYELVATLFALGAYLRLALGGRLEGAWWMVAGVFTTIAAACVQVSGMIRFRVIWEFDSNGAFHLLQMLAILFLMIGLRRSLRPSPS